MAVLTILINSCWQYSSHKIQILYSVTILFIFEKIVAKLGLWIMPRPPWFKAHNKLLVLSTDHHSHDHPMTGSNRIHPMDSSSQKWILYPCIDGHAWKISTRVGNGFSEPDNCSCISLKDQGMINTYYKGNYYNAVSWKVCHHSGLWVSLATDDSFLHFFFV
jgi:hypothetical protein